MISLPRYHLDDCVLDKELFDIALFYHPKPASKVPPISTTAMPTSYLATVEDPYSDDHDLSLLPSIATLKSKEATPSPSLPTLASPTIHDAELLLLLRGKNEEVSAMALTEKEFATFKHGSFLLYPQRGLIETLPLSYGCVSVSQGASVQEEVPKDSKAAGAVDPLLTAYLNVHQPSRHSGYMFNSRTGRYLPQNAPNIRSDEVPSILESPKELCMCVDGLKPGCAYSAVIVFPQRVLLTDINIQANTYMFSVAIDTWLQDGDVPCRVVQSHDLLKRSLIIGNLSPPPLCCYARITYVAKMSATSEKCAVSLGTYHGRPDCLLDYPSLLVATETRLTLEYHLHREELEDALSMYSQGEPPSAVLGRQMEKQVASLYQKCSNAQIKLARMHYMVQESKKGKRERGGISLARLRSVAATTVQLPLKKLHKLAVCLVDVLLILLSKGPNVGVSESLVLGNNDCRNLFMSFCVGESPSVHARLCALLITLYGNQRWWGSFLSETLASLFNEPHPLIKFDKERYYYCPMSNC